VPGTYPSTGDRETYLDEYRLSPDELIAERFFVKYSVGAVAISHCASATVGGEG
jgi:hypothetical protein